MSISLEENSQAELFEKLILEKYEPIAIIGVSIRFPGNNNDLATFATMLSEGREGISTIPESRWDNSLYYSAIRGVIGKNCTNQGGYIDDFDKFDAKFFSISPKEANNIDPQQRVMLELAWEALENANINPETLRGGNGSVYIGGSTIDFAKELVNLADDALESHMATGAALIATCDLSEPIASEKASIALSGSRNFTPFFSILRNFILSSCAAIPTSLHGPQLIAKPYIF